MTSRVLPGVEGPEGAGKSTLVAGAGGPMRQDGTEPWWCGSRAAPGGAEALRRICSIRSSELTPMRSCISSWPPAPIWWPGSSGRRSTPETVVVADRFDLSTVAYQVGGPGPRSNRWSGVPTVPPPAGWSPISPWSSTFHRAPGSRQSERPVRECDRLEREDDGFHQRVAAAYRRASGRGLVHLDGAQSPDEVLHRAWDEVVQARAAAKPQSS